MTDIAVEAKNQILSITTQKEKVNLNFPSAADLKGKEVTVYFKSKTGSKNIDLNPKTGELIAGDTSKTISQEGSAATITSDGKELFFK